MEKPRGDIFYTSKLNDYALCGEVGDDTVTFTGQLASFEDKIINKAARRCASSTRKMFLFFVPHIVIPCLEIYPIKLIQENKSFMYEVVHCNIIHTKNRGSRNNCALV